MKDLKKYMVFGAIFVSVIGTLLHFAYAFSGGNFFVGLVTPVNESVWEHMKLLFFPMLFYAFLKPNRFSASYPCIGSSMAHGILRGTFCIAILFYTYSGILGFHLAVMDILIFYISVYIAFSSAYRDTISCTREPMGKWITLFLCILCIAFFVFSVYPPNIALFKAP